MIAIGLVVSFIWTYLREIAMALAHRGVSSVRSQT
jgi:hypothetical protein